MLHCCNGCNRKRNLHGIKTQDRKAKEPQKILFDRFQELFPTQAADQKKDRGRDNHADCKDRIPGKMLISHEVFQTVAAASP